VSKLASVIWPPAKTWKRSILWAFGIGFVLQIAVPEFLEVIGAGHAAFYSMILGFWPAMMATKSGWNSSLSRVGYFITFGINTLVYGSLLLIGLRSYVRLKTRET
jgi:hypothetical protein